MVPFEAIVHAHTVDDETLADAQRRRVTWVPRDFILVVVVVKVNLTRNNQALAVGSVGITCRRIARTGGIPLHIAVESQEILLHACVSAADPIIGIIHVVIV